MKHLVLSAALLLGSLLVAAQHDRSAREFFEGSADCGPSLGGWKCLELDLSSEVNEESDSTKVYAYSWNFGDGTRQDGETIEHCYEQFGSYQVTMDLIDHETNTVIRNELSTTVHLYPEIRPTIDINNSENLPPTYREFRAESNNKSFHPDKVFWSIDGAYYEGHSVRHNFPMAGVYTVRMGVLKDMDFLGTVTACTTTEVTIKDSDLWTTELRDFFKDLHKDQESGPFISEEIVCSVRSMGPDSLAFAVPLTALMGRLSSEMTDTYEIMLFSGNLFTGLKRVHTHGLSSSDVYQAFRDTVKAFAGRPVTALPPLNLQEDFDGILLEHSELQKLADMLKRHSGFRVTIGAYLFSGSRIHKGIQSALQRASAVKDALMKMGVRTDQVEVATPENHPSLVNTCSARIDCEWENPGLDGKVEFKIIETDL